jgi:hypothetical protein
MPPIGWASHFFEHGNEPWPYKIREFCSAVEKLSVSTIILFGLLVVGFFYSLVRLFGYFVS